MYNKELAEHEIYNVGMFKSSFLSGPARHILHLLLFVSYDDEDRNKPQQPVVYSLAVA